MKYNDLKIGTKMYSGFILVTALTMVVGFIGYFGISRIVYQLEISKSETFAGDLVNLVFDENSHTVTQTLEGSTQYYWRVRTRANDVYSRWSEVRTFTTETGVPELVYPIDGQEGVPLNASMTWNAVELATDYDIQISEDESLQNLVYEMPEIAGTTIAAQNLESYTNYVWRVRANNGDSKGKWSGFEPFTTIPGPPTLIFPPNESVGISTQSEFEFLPAEGSDASFIQISTEETMEDESKYLASIATNTDTTHSTQFLQFNRTYYWRMRSDVISSDGVNQVTYSSEFSDIFTFTTGATAPNLQLPTDNSVDLDPNQVELSWNAVSDAESYEFQVSLDPEFGDFVLNDSQTERTFDLSGLDGYTVYYWRVRAIVGGQPGSWSAVWQFRTWINGPETSFPECGVTGINPSGLRVVWDLVKGGELYLVEISETTNFDSPLQSLDEINSDRVDVEGLESNRQYFWRVRGFNEESTGQWSEVCEFETAPNSINEIFDADLEVYPNPASDIFNVKINTKKLVAVTINLYSVDGLLSAVLFDGNLEYGSNLLQFNAENYSNGKYILEIKTPEGNINKDIIIQR